MSHRRCPRDQKIDRGTVVFDVNPIAHVATIAVERERFVFERIGDEERNEFLGMLVRAEIVGATRDDDGHVVRREIGKGEAVGAGFAGGVGVARVQRRVLGETAAGNAAVNFVSGNLDKLFTPNCRAASSNVNAPSTSVLMKSSAQRIERSTCVSAAKLTTISMPAESSFQSLATNAWSAMSPLTN